MYTPNCKLTTKGKVAVSLALLTGTSLISLSPAVSQVPSPGRTPGAEPTPRPVPTRRPVQPLTPGVEVRQSRAPRPATPMSGTSTRALQISLQGVVTKTARDGEFFLSANETVYRVRPWNTGLSQRVEGGDRVRVFGQADGLMISVANVRVLEKRASDSPEPY